MFRPMPPSTITHNKNKRALARLFLLCISLSVNSKKQHQQLLSNSGIPSLIKAPVWKFSNQNLQADK
jgi:hypothetical protein